MNDRERIYSLRKEINYHNHAYYVKDAPEISDFEFDALLNKITNNKDKNIKELINLFLSSAR